MDILPLLLVVFILALPFLALAYAIFLIRENSTYKYGSIYLRAIVIALLPILVIAAYFYAPLIMNRTEEALRNAEVGRYINAKTGDTMQLYGGTLEYRYHDKPADNFTIGYVLYDNYNNHPLAAFKRGVYNYFFSNNILLSEHTLRMTYPMNYKIDAYQRGNARKKKNIAPTSHPHVEMVYQVSQKDGRTIFIPASDSSATGIFLKQ